MKKTLCVIIAVIIAFSSFAIVSYAAAPEFSMKADKTNAKVGDVITVTVSVAKKSNLCAATLDLVYDNEFFKLVSFTATEALGATINQNFAKNKARYVAVHERFLKDEAVLFTAQFEVIKRGGKISLEAKEVYHIADNTRTEVTNEVNESLKNKTITIVCPHSDKTTTTVSEPTCAKEGKKVEKCKECGLTTEITIAKLAHTPKDVVTKNATCKEAGEKAKQCTVCGEIYDKTVVPALPHTPKDVVTKNATCKEAGEKAKQCTVCGEIYDRTVVPALPHNMQEVVIKQATCKEAGVEGKQCTVCGHTSDEKTIPVIPHELNTVVIKEATCEEAGKKVEQCANCDYKGEEKEIPATGHVEGKWETVKVSTKTEPGLEQKKCTVCGAVLDSREIPVVTTYKLGDVNEDGHVTAVDARIVLQYVAGLKTPTSAQKLAADTNKDGSIGASDARLILQYVAGLAKF